MSVKNKPFIKVYNPTVATVCVETRNRGYAIPPVENGKSHFELLTFDDIDYINSRCNAFSTGVLTFDEEDADEIFAALRIIDKSNIFSEEDIDDVLLNPSEENQARIIAVSDTLTIDRIRGRMTKFINDGKEDVPTRIVGLVNARYKEICAGKRNTELGVKAIEKSPEAKQIDDLKSQLAQMQALMEQMASNSETTTSANSNTPAKGSVPQAKKSGRPKKAAEPKEG